MGFKTWSAVLMLTGLLAVPAVAQDASTNSASNAQPELNMPQAVTPTPGPYQDPGTATVQNAGPGAGNNTQVWNLPTANVSGRLDILQLKDMDINDVLNMLSARTGVNIVAGKGVQGRVTMFLKNVDVRTALTLILKSNGFAYEEHDGVLAIVTEAEYEQKHGTAFGVDTKTEVFDLSYAKAESIAKTLVSMLSKDVGKIEPDTTFNKLIITDTSENLERIRKVIVSLDKSEKEVLIEARIVQLTLKNGKSAGINWTTYLAEPHRYRVTLGSNLSLSETLGQFATIGTLDRDGYHAVLQALASEGSMKTLSSPSIAVTNNQEAKIHIGKTQPYVTTAQTVTATGPITNSETVNFIDVGVKLNVTPMIHDDGFITMKVRPEVSTANDFLTTGTPTTDPVTGVTTGNRNSIPIVVTSEVDTTIRVMDGVTIVIGGLIRDDATREESKIPLLGDIPLLGKAFRSSKRSKDKEEIVIFLTPHIITGDVAVDPDKYLTLKDNKFYQ